MCVSVCCRLHPPSNFPAFAQCSRAQPSSSTCPHFHGPPPFPFHPPALPPAAADHGSGRGVRAGCGPGGGAPRDHRHVGHAAGAAAAGRRAGGVAGGAAAGAGVPGSPPRGAVHRQVRLVGSDFPFVSPAPLVAVPCPPTLAFCVRPRAASCPNDSAAMCRPWIAVAALVGWWGRCLGVQGAQAPHWCPGRAVASAVRTHLLPRHDAGRKGGAVYPGRFPLPPPHPCTTPACPCEPGAPVNPCACLCVSTRTLLAQAAGLARPTHPLARATHACACAFAGTFTTRRHAYSRMHRPHPSPPEPSLRGRHVRLLVHPHRFPLIHPPSCVCADAPCR